jgi:hypothetical protein
MSQKTNKPKIREYYSSGISKDTLKFKKFKKVIKLSDNKKEITDKK